MSEIINFANFDRLSGHCLQCVQRMPASRSQQLSCIVEGSKDSHRVISVRFAVD